MILLRLISWPYFRKHVLRTALTTAGIVLGVAVFVGMHTANQSVLAAFRQTIDRIAGSTQLQVSAGEPGLDEAVLEPGLARLDADLGILLQHEGIAFLQYVILLHFDAFVLFLRLLVLREIDVHLRG